MKNWKMFEQAVYSIQKQLSPNSTIYYDHSVVGKTTKISRQIDIALYDTIGQISIFIAIECKDYKRAVDIKEVEAFYSKLQDINANKGVMVSSNGFTQSTIEMAKDKNIELYTLSNVPFEEELSIRCPIKVNRMSHYSFIANGIPTDFHNKKDFDIEKIKLFSRDNKYIGEIIPFIINSWNSGNLPADFGSSEVEFKDFKIGYGIGYVNITFIVKYIVSSQLYTKNVKVVELAEFKDIIHSKLVLQTAKTEAFYADNPILDVSWHETDYFDLTDLEKQQILEARELFEIK